MPQDPPAFPICFFQYNTFCRHSQEDAFFGRNWCFLFAILLQFLKKAGKNSLRMREEKKEKTEGSALKRKITATVCTALLGIILLALPGAVLNAIPGILAQLLLIPAVMVALGKTKLIPFGTECAG